MRVRVHARRMLKGLVADLRIINEMNRNTQLFACFRKCFENILPFSEIIFQ